MTKNESAQASPWTHKERDTLFGMIHIGADKAAILASLPGRTWGAISSYKRKMKGARYGTQMLCQPETRPDGVIVRTTMLDPSDPGECDNDIGSRRDDRTSSSSRLWRDR